VKGLICGGKYLNYGEKMPKLLANIQDQKLYLDQDYESYEALKELDGKRVD